MRSQRLADGVGNGGGHDGGFGGGNGGGGIGGGHSISWNDPLLTGSSIFVFIEKA